MSTKPYLGPIIRDAGYSSDDAAFHECKKEYPVYYVYLYRERKPVYRLTCMYKNMLEDSINTFLQDDSSLKQILPISERKVFNYTSYEDVSVDFLDE